MSFLVCEYFYTSYPDVCKVSQCIIIIIRILHIIIILVLWRGREREREREGEGDIIYWLSHHASCVHMYIQGNEDAPPQ